MADKEANLIIRLKDEASASLKGISGKIQELTGSVIGTTIQFGALVAVVGKSLKAFFEQEDAVNKLNIALKNQGIFSAELSREMQQYANQLQRTTTFSDEAILNTQALLTTFGLAGSAMRDATKTALDLSKGLGIDLNTATLLLGKAFAGETGALSRYGIVIDENIPKSERFAAVMEQLNERFGGSAQAAAGTYSGQIERLKNAFGELAEETGQALAPALGFLAGHLQSVIDNIQQLGGLGSTMSLMFADMTMGIVNFITNALLAIPGVNELFKIMKIDLQAITAGLQENVDQMYIAAAQENQVNQQRLLDKTMLTNQMLTQEKRWTTEAVKEAKKRESEGRIATEKQMKLDIDSIERRRLAEETANQARMAGFLNAMNFISSLSQSKNKELAAIGKAAAIFEITISTFRAGMGAYAALAPIPIVGPALGRAAQAAALAAGFAQVAKVQGMQLAEGGIVMPRMGGIQATIGEGGSAEAVIPLNSDRAREQMQDAGIGNSVTVNVSVGNLVGSDGMREFAKVLDKELFSLRRNNESVAFEAI